MATHVLVISALSLSRLALHRHPPSSLSLRMAQCGRISPVAQAAFTRRRIIQPSTEAVKVSKILWPVVKLRSGDGPLSVRGCPSTVKGTRRSFLTAPPKASSGPALERRSLCTPSGQKPRARPEPARTGCGPSPIRCRRSRVPTATHDRSTPGTHGHSRTARYSSSPGQRQADPPTFQAGDQASCTPRAPAHGESRSHADTRGQPEISVTDDHWRPLRRSAGCREACDAVVRGGGRTADLPLFRIKEHCAGLARKVYLAAQGSCGAR
jgi:hypothetical protein